MINLSEIIGIIGAVFLAIAWVPAILEIIKNKRSDLNKKFAVTMWIATFLLLVYSITIKNFVFITINAIIWIQVNLALYYEFIVEPRAGKKQKRK